MNKDIRINARLNKGQYDKLAKLLKSKGMTISEWVRQAIDRARIK